MRHVAGIAVALRHRDRLHQVPAREVRAADVADLTDTDELIEGGKSFFDRRVVVLAVELQEVDVFDAEPDQSGVHRLENVLTRRAEIVGPGSHRERRLGRDQQPVALALDRLAEDGLGQAARIDVGAVEQRDAVVEADVDQVRRACRIGRAPGAEEVVAAAERGRAEREGRDAQAGMAETIEVHGVSCAGLAGI